MLREMATGGGLPLPDDEARLWFSLGLNCYEVCALAKGWNDQKKLLQIRLPTLLKGRA